MKKQRAIMLLGQITEVFFDMTEEGQEMLASMALAGVDTSKKNKPRHLKLVSGSDVGNLDRFGSGS